MVPIGEDPAAPSSQTCLEDPWAPFSSTVTPKQELRCGRPPQQSPMQRRSAHRYWGKRSISPSNKECLSCRPSSSLFLKDKLLIPRELP